MQPDQRATDEEAVATHTPGPWRVEGAYSRSIRGRDGTEIALMRLTYNGGQNEAGIANAHLIVEAVNAHLAAQRTASDTGATAEVERLREALTLPPIENDDVITDREYIPLPGGWEVQTKGGGSSFRIANQVTGERHNLMVEEYVQRFITDMARNIHAHCNAALNGSAAHAD